MADAGPVPAAERIRFDDPAQVARAIADLPRPLLVGTDVDGTLSVLAATPGQAHLVDGADHALERLQECGVDVAVVSGRTVAELVHHFGMPADAHMIGSHGAEADNTMPRTDAESLLLQRVDEVLMGIAVEHPGALVERKPFASALHVRQCEPAVGDRALRSVEPAMAELSGVRVLPGDRVQEVMVRYTTKATALADLCRRLRPRSVVFLGDDVSTSTCSRRWRVAPPRLAWPLMHAHSGCGSVLRRPLRLTAWRHLTMWSRCSSISRS